LKNNSEIKILFVVDCTGSMEKWINATKENIVKIVYDLKNYFPLKDIEVGFLGYRDFDDKE
jgi:hypothetical protein